MHRSSTPAAKPDSDWPATSHPLPTVSLVVLALPRGGVPVAAEIAARLGVPFDVFVVRKLGVPGHEELAMGAVASGGVRVLNPEVDPAARHHPGQSSTGWPRKELQEIDRREREYRGGRALPSLDGATVVLVDDGVATGFHHARRGRSGADAPALASGGRRPGHVARCDQHADSVPRTHASTSRRRSRSTAWRPGTGISSRSPTTRCASC